MKRNVSLDEISDGKLYGINDCVKANSHGCVGCHKCCTHMGSSIILDPYDAYRISKYLKVRFECLIQSTVELNVVDGVILPNIRMAGNEEKCSFLNEDGRCTIHEARPGICRLFPLGRYYENGSFRYFLQTGECDAVRSKVKIEKWIDTKDIKRNTRFVTTWHYFLNDIEKMLMESEDDLFKKNVNLLLLRTFYLEDYDDTDFYSQFENKLNYVRGILQI